MRPALVYFGVRATDGGGCLFKLVPYVSYKFSSVSTKRFPSALSYFLAINLSSPFPRPACVYRLPAASAVDREVEAFCIFHLFLGTLREAERVPVSFFRNCKGGDPWPGNWNSPLRTRRRRWSRSVEREDGRLREGTLHGEHTDDCALLRRP